MWLIGSGQMAIDYAKVFQSLKEDFVVIGRGKESARNFEESTGVSVQTGGVERALSSKKAPDVAFVAVGVEKLASTAMLLIKAGTKRILLEKPGGLNIAELKDIENEAKLFGTEILLGYNRRFYASTLQAEEIISVDGGVTSFHFEFTEWSHQIRNLKKSSDVMRSWVLSNSSHVLDLAFHLGGLPRELQTWSKGGVNWHPLASRFCGAGITELGALFSYFADWEAPGRWGIEILTRKSRLILRPMEKLQITSLGSINVESLELNDDLDKDFKPGIYLQTKSFLVSDTERFCTIKDQVENAKIYSKIAGYSL